MRRVPSGAFCFFRVRLGKEGFLMDQEGIVSVWTGVFESDKALWDYAGYMDGTDLITPFSRDFFGGSDCYPFDEDLWERSVHEFTEDPETLVRPYSEGTAIGPELKKLFPQGLSRACNAAILVYDYLYNEDESPCIPDGPVRFLAAVPYDKG